MKLLKEKECFSLTPVELLALEAGWSKGEFRDIIPSVNAFIEEQETVIRSQLGPQANGDQIARALIDLLLSNGSLDQGAEMLAQKEEILKELWICGERGDHDRDRITSEWTVNYAERWRRWRVLTYIFIASKLLVGIFNDIKC